MIVTERIRAIADRALEESRRPKDADMLSLCAACTDYTTLSHYDSPSSVKAFTDMAVEFNQLGLPPVASICVFPSLVEAVGLELGESPIGITAVCGAFPHGQTYIEVKMLECAMAIENGADEVEIVINIAEMLAGETDIARSEIETIAGEINGDALLKVTLETGALVDPELIYLASRIALDAGADFIKTSTGSTLVGATAEAAAVMCTAISDHRQAKGSKAGFIASGGVERVEDATVYAGIVRGILGEEWLAPEYFRIGGQKILSDIVRHFRDI